MSIFKKSWTRKPEGRPILNRAHPLAAELRFFFLFNETTGDIVDLVKGYRGVATGTIDRQIGEQGREARIDEDEYFSVTHDADLNITEELTLLCWSKVDNTNDENAFLIKRTTSISNNCPFCFYTDKVITSGPLRLIRAGVEWSNWESDVEISSGVYNIFSVSHSGPINVQPIFYINGIGPVGTSTVRSRSGTVAGNTEDLVLGKRLDGFFDMQGEFVLAAGWARMLDDAEHVSLHRNPFQILKYPTHIWIQSPVVGEVTVQPGSGTVDYAGQTPTIRTFNTVQPTQGDVLYAGQEPTIRTLNTVQPNSGDLLYAGQIPNIVAEFTVRPDTGQIVYAGQDPTIRTFNTVQPTQGELLYAGFAPTIETFRTVSPASGQVLYAGQEPTIRSEYLVLPDSGTLTYEGQQPVIAVVGAITVQPGSGALTYLGQDPTLRTEYRLGPDTGTVVYAGQIPTILTEQIATVQPTQGQVLYSGQAPTLRTEIRLGPNSGAVVYEGQIPTVVGEQIAIVQPGSGEVFYAGQTPVIDLFTHIRPTQGQIVYNGLSPTLRTEIAVSLQSGAVLYAGQQPAVTGVSRDIWSAHAAVVTSWSDHAGLSTTWTSL